MQDASLEYETLARAGDMSKLRIVLHTGRTHQIRCQFAAHGHPLLGDRKYGLPDDGTDDSPKDTSSDGQAPDIGLRYFIDRP